MSSGEAESHIEILALKHFDRVGFASAGRPPTLPAYEEWILGGHHGRMDYLKRHIAKKRDPGLLLEGAKSWVVLLLNYDTQEPLSTELRDEFYRDKTGWVARYARGGDYHDEIGARHKLMIAELERIFPKEKFLSAVDTKAVLERDTAARAGLGWIGKNTCLIHQDLGSFVFVSEILTTLELAPSKPVADHCGTCTRCLDACPTGALTGPHILDATKCISYWTIEVNDEPPAQVSSKFGYNFFGCDICQDVCPWNQKARRQNHLKVPEETGVIDPQFFLNAAEGELKSKYKNSAMNRAKPRHLKRNAEILVKNLSKRSDGGNS